jgi:hypothetical protein
MKKIERIGFRDFFGELMNGKLVGYKCKDCGKYTCPPQSVCQECGSENIELAELRNKGTLRSFTVIYIPPTGLEDEAPYIVAFVETDDEPWLIGRLDYDPDKATQDLIGKKVSIGHQELHAVDYYPDKERRVVPLFKLEE